MICSDGSRAPSVLFFFIFFHGLFLLDSLGSRRGVSKVVFLDVFFVDFVHLPENDVDAVA